MLFELCPDRARSISTQKAIGKHCRHDLGRRFEGGIRLERILRIWSKEAAVCSFQPCLENTPLIYFYKLTETRIYLCHLKTIVKNKG